MGPNHDTGLETPPEIYQCESCGNLAFGEVAEVRCCGTSMTAVDRVTVDIDLPEPKFDQVLQTVFGLPLTGLEIIHWLMGRGEVKARAITDALGYDRSTITRNLDSLTDAGLVERRSEAGHSGGRVYLYSVGDTEGLRRQFRRGLYVWMTQVVQDIDEFVPEQDDR